MQSLAQRSFRPVCLTRARRVRVVCEAGSVSSVRFAVHKHTHWGQSVLVVGGHAAMGNWSPEGALALTWTEGDVWQGTAALDVGSAIDYKYIIKAKEAVEWAPGANKTIKVPSAASVEVKDNWDGPAGKLTVLDSAAPAAAAVQAAAAEVLTPAGSPTPVEVVAAAVQAEAPAPVMNLPEVMAAAETATANASGNGHVNVTTMENIAAEELMPPSALVDEAAATHAPHSGVGGDLSASGAGLLVNNVVAAPPGMSAVGAAASDPITQYEEADKMQVLEVTSSGTATLTETKPRTFDAYTVAELKTECKKRGMSSFGTRRELVTRLQKAGF